MLVIYFLSFLFFAYLPKTNNSNVMKYNSIILYCFREVKLFYFYCLFVDRVSLYCADWPVNQAMLNQRELCLL